MALPVVVVDSLTVDLPPQGERPHAVEDISLELRANEILCVVGESGSGKSILARSIMGLFPSPQVRASAGRVLLNGENLLAASPARMREIRGTRPGSARSDGLGASAIILRPWSRRTK